jgi:hypothetical protein
MPFSEKSAWVMTLALLVGTVCYVGVVGAMSVELGRVAPPLLPIVAVFAGILTVLAAVGHAVIAALRPREATTTLDERERAIVVRASHRAGIVLGAGSITALGVYLFTYDGDLLFHGVFASLVLAQLAEYGMQIVLHRSRIA